MREMERIFAVIDTNVIVSSLFSLDGLSAPAIVVGAVLRGAIIPVFNDDILNEYKEVLSRSKFPFNESQIELILSAFKDFGINVERTIVAEESFPDPDDIVFYEVKMSVDDAFLVTGNNRHFPHNSLVVTPSKMVEILLGRGLL